MKKIFFKSIVAFVMISASLQAMQDNYHSVLLPGQNGCGGEDFSSHSVIVGQYSAFETLKNPMWKVDLGQGNCIRNFEEQFVKDNKTKGKKLRLHGVSQGTATLVNWIAQKPIAEQEKLIGSIFLEAVLGSGNRAIFHTVEKCVSSKLTYLPFARLWIPAAGKVIFPTYNPWGMQVLKSATSLSANIPVIMMHHVNDTQLSVNDARELYCALREKNTPAYLIEINNNDSAHFSTLGTEKKAERNRKKGILQAIYKKHNLPYIDSLLTIDSDNGISEFQPDINEVKKRIADSTWKGRWIRNTIDIASGGIIAGWLAYKWYKK